MPYHRYVREKLVQTASGGFMCTLCGNQQKYRKNVRRHYLQAHYDLAVIYTCPTCGPGATARSADEFLLHVSAAHPEWNGVRPEDFLSVV